MADKALYCSNDEVVPAGSADGILKRTAANDGWEFKTAAQLGIAATVKQTAFAEQAVNTTTGSGTFGDLGTITLTLTTTAGSFLLINFTASASNASANTNIDYQLVIDGSPVRGCGTRNGNATNTVV